MITIEITTLSPVHIGSGEKYNGLAYWVKNNNILVYTTEQVLSNIPQSYYNQFISWIETQISDIERLEHQIRNERNKHRKNELKRQKNEIQSSFSLKNFFNNLKNNQGLEKNFLYKLNCITVYDNVDIESFIKQNNKVYIPGSEIKGAIRTAVLYNLLKENGNWKYLKNELNNFKNKFNVTLQIIRNRRASDRLSNDEIEKVPLQEKYRLFGNRMPNGIKISDIKKVLNREMKKIEEELQKKIFRTNNKDAKYDLLKFLSISDSDSKSPDDCLFVSYLETLNTSRRFRIFQELLKPNQIFTYSINLNSNALILDKLGFSDTQKNIISSIDKIFRCCYEFTNKLIDEEINYFQQQNRNDIVEKLDSIKEQNKENSPVIRIGKNEGYLSLTIGLLIKEKDPNLYNNIVIHTTKNTSYSNNFPKTRRIVNMGNNNWDTLGWAKLSKVNN